MQPYDCRAEVFRMRGHEVFGSVVQGTQVAQPDPFDVQQVHGEARSAFTSTLDDVKRAPASRILLVRGEAGCGKTHLIRALRASTHASRSGMLAYVHMTSELGDYRQYLLRQVVKSLSDPYFIDAGSARQQNGLDVISDALVQPGALDEAAAEALAEADDAALAELVTGAADRLVEIANPDGTPRFGGVDLNTLRILLYRQSTRRPIQRRVGSFLNGESLSEMDWKILGAMPRDCNRSPMHLLEQLARVTMAAAGIPLVICIDQIEASDITGKNHDPFRHAMATACELIENVPHLMILLSCLDSAYDAHAPHLIVSYRHRIENDPAPVMLTAARSAHEVRQIVSRRLKWLYESEGLAHVPPDSVYPMPEEAPQGLQKQHLRVILQRVRQYSDECRQVSPPDLPEWKVDLPMIPAAPGPGQDADRLRLAWNEFRTAGDHRLSEDDNEQFDLLCWALGQLTEELPDASIVDVAPVAGADGQPPAPAVFLTLRRLRAEPARFVIGLCDKDPRGGGFNRQITSLEAMRQDQDQTIVVMRSTRFPKRGKAADHLKELHEDGGALVVADEASWQTIHALRSFLSTGAKDFAENVVREWRTTDGPLLSLPQIMPMLAPPRGTSPGKQAGDGGPSRSRGAPREDGSVPRTLQDPRPNPEPQSRRPALEPREKEGVAAVRAGNAHHPPLLPPLTAPLDHGILNIGKSDGFSGGATSLPMELLTRHTAIFGANGSGKTVLALSIVEMLLERGVSVVLFDRKGDLAVYADDAAWGQSTGAPDEQRRRAALRASADVHLYTPGSSDGRPLVLPLLPQGLEKLEQAEREEEARQAALILCDVCAPTAGKADMFATVLTRAVELIATAQVPQTLDVLQDLLLQSPQELMSRLPAHGPKHCAEVGRRLSERRITYGRLFSDEGERLDLRRLLPGREARRPRLNIISTQFLDGDASLIWIAQFLAAAGRFILESPSAGGKLQALLMFDEADQYIPATRKPATKPGMENLLRRARAAGVGVMLASQNVGDFDYKALDNITTAFAGKLTTPRALEKLRSRLGDSVDRLSRKSRGHFTMGIESDVKEIVGHMSLLKPLPVPREQIERLAAVQNRRQGTGAGGGVA